MQKIKNKGSNNKKEGAQRNCIFIQYFLILEFLFVHKYFISHYYSREKLFNTYTYMK